MEGTFDISTWPSSTMIFLGDSTTGTGFHLDRAYGYNIAFALEQHSRETDDDVLAVWTFVRADKISDLSKHFHPRSLGDDPKSCYLSDQDYESFKRSWGTEIIFRIEQRRGDIVRIPLGWLHSVENKTPNLKVG